MVRGAKLNSVTINQMENEQRMVVVRVEQFQGTYEKARKDEHAPNHICGVLARYKHYKEKHEKITGVYD